MCERVRGGFNVIELAVVTAVVILFVLALVPAMWGCGCSASMCVVGSRGRDIYVAITGANTERAPLGLPPAWPSDGVRMTNTVGDIASVVFTNSTDYFHCLLDGKNAGTEKWTPFVAGVDFSALAGGGVPACKGGKLTAENNIWTVAMNVRDDMADIVPILITRNIDASSLAASFTEEDSGKLLRFDPDWDTPFGDKVYVMIRKGGAIFKARAKYMSYGTVYCKQPFDTSADEHGKPAAHPLKYLTPTRSIVPGERTYAEGAVRAARLSGTGWERVTRALKTLAGLILPAGACIGTLYLLVAGVYGVRRYRQRLKPCLSGYGVGVGLFHFAAVVFWSCMVLAGAGACISVNPLTLLALAVLAQVMGIAFVAARQREDPVARQSGMMWMVSAPLTFLGLYVVAIVVDRVASLFA